MMHPVEDTAGRSLTPNSHRRVSGIWPFYCRASSLATLLFIQSTHQAQSPTTEASPIITTEQDGESLSNDTPGTEY